MEDQEENSPEALLDEKAYDEQYELIRKQYGKKKAEMANYGWGVAGDDTYASIATKVYGVGVLQSTVEYATKRITHEWQ